MLIMLPVTYHMILSMFLSHANHATSYLSYDTAHVPVPCLSCYQLPIIWYCPCSCPMLIMLPVTYHMILSMFLSHANHATSYLSYDTAHVPVPCLSCYQLPIIWYCPCSCPMLIMLPVTYHMILSMFLPHANHATSYLSYDTVHVPVPC